MYLGLWWQALEFANVGFVAIDVAPQSGERGEPGVAALEFDPQIASELSSTSSVVAATAKSASSRDGGTSYSRIF